MSDVTIDLDSDSEVLFTADIAPQEPRRSVNQQGYELGVCRVCGAEAASRAGTYCEEHRTRAPKGSGTSTVAKAQRTPRKGVAPTGDEWSGKLFGKAVLILTSLFAASSIRRYNINDPNEQIQDALTATDEECRAIAKPLGRVLAGTSFNKRYGRKVLDNSDLLDAGFALYDWYDRVNKTLKTFAGQTHLASVQPIRPETREPTADEAYQATVQPGSPGGDFPDFPLINPI